MTSDVVDGNWAAFKGEDDTSLSRIIIVESYYFAKGKKWGL